MQALYSWDLSKASTGELLELKWVDDPARNEDTLSFARLIIAGYLENRETVDAQIDSHLEHWDINRLSRVDLAVLRMAAYSLLYLPDIPASVTIDEAIAIAKEFGADESYKFVNGVLDAIRRDTGAR